MANPHADLEKMMVASAEQMGRAASQLANGTITVEAWRDSMQAASRNLHTAATALAAGEWGKVSQSAWGTCGARLKAEYKYLDNFAAQIANGTQRVSYIDPVTGETIPDGRFGARAAMYANSGHSTYENAFRDLAIEAGYTEEALVTTSLESCSDCEADASLGWVPIGSLDDLGTRTCLSSCMCEMEFR